MFTIALTCGEPAGIGPDICAAIASGVRTDRLVLVGDRDVLAARARALGLALALPDYDPGGPRVAGASVLHVPVSAPVLPGKLDARNARQVLATLERACDGCMSGEFDAMVTAPVQKSVINDSGVAFSGHTEFLAERAGSPQVVMMLAGGGLRVALATTHLPLRAVAAAISRELVESVLGVLHADLIAHFGIAAPRIRVAGLNPHAGEGGHLGNEEILAIAPAIEAVRGRGWLVDGPLPADTLFTPAALEGVDCVLAMYHDQGLPVLKHAGFGEAVNITLGLPFVRTSVDHGTALDMAGTGRAGSGSLRAAIDAAAAMVVASRSRRR